MFRRSKQGAINVISGDVGIHGEHLSALTLVAEECLSEGQPRAVLDLRDVPLVDSAGLELLLDLRESFEQRAGRLKLAAPNALCRDIFNVTGVGTSFEIHPDVKLAVGSFVQ